jgi:hypothetical protein
MFQVVLKVRLTARQLRWFFRLLVVLLSVWYVM